MPFGAKGHGRRPQPKVHRAWTRTVASGRKPAVAWSEVKWQLLSHSRPSMLKRFLGRCAGVLLSFTAVCSVVLPNDHVLPNDYVLIEARLTGTEQNHTWTVEQKERTFDLQVPSARFEVLRPESLAGRSVRIIFHQGDLTDLLDVSGNETTEFYLLEIWRANTELPGEIEVSDLQVNRIQPISDADHQ